MSTTSVLQFDGRKKGSKVGTRFMKTMGLIEMIRPVVSIPDDVIDSKVWRSLRIGTVHRHRSSFQFVTPDQIEPGFLGRDSNNSDRISNQVYGSYHGTRFSENDRVRAGSQLLQEIREG